jgi:hypothetical protein
MYHQVISQCTQSLKNLETCLDKAEQHAAAKKFAVGVLMTSRLAPDMQHLIYQIQSACDYVKAAAAWLSGQTPPKHEDNEQTIDELRARIRKTVAFAESVKEAQYAGASERKQTLLGTRQSHRRRGLPDADDDPQHLFPHRDGLRHPPPRRRRCRKDGFSWSYQSGRRVIGLGVPFKLAEMWGNVWHKAAQATAAAMSAAGKS